MQPEPGSVPCQHCMAWLYHGGYECTASVSGKCRRCKDDCERVPEHMSEEAACLSLFAWKCLEQSKTNGHHPSLILAVDDFCERMQTFTESQPRKRVRLTGHASAGESLTTQHEASNTSSLTARVLGSMRDGARSDICEQTNFKSPPMGGRKDGGINPVDDFEVYEDGNAVFDSQPVHGPSTFAATGAFELPSMMALDLPLRQKRKTLHKEGVGRSNEKENATFKRPDDHPQFDDKAINVTTRQETGLASFTIP